MLSIVILDSVSEIWTTPWGRLRIVKTLLVGMAAVGGGYNHKIIIPTLAKSPGDKAVANRFARIITIEAIALAGVAIVTGWPQRSFLNSMARPRELGGDRPS